MGNVSCSKATIVKSVETDKSIGDDTANVSQRKESSEKSEDFTKQGKTVIIKKTDQNGNTMVVRTTHGPQQKQDISNPTELETLPGMPTAD